MKTHIDIDAELVEFVREHGGYRTKKEAVDAALRELAADMALANLLALRGTADGREGRPAWHRERNAD